MAARENQGYLIAVIILVLLTLVLALSTFLAIQSANESADKASSEEKQRMLYEALADANQIESQIYLAFIGDVGGPSVAEVQTNIDSIERLRNNSTLDDSEKDQLRQVIDRIKGVKDIYDADMRQNIASEDSDATQEFTWKGLIGNLATVVANKHNMESVLRGQASDAESNAAAKIAAKDEELKKKDEAFNVVNVELSEEKKRAAAKEQQLQSSLDQITKQNADNVRSFEEARKKLAQEISGQLAKIGGLEKNNESLKRRIDMLTKEDFDLPDGKIVRVSPKLNRVYLDLGWTDGLRANRTFSIYDKSVTNFQQGEEKAMVEVIDVTGPHSAEARVTQENPLKPILQGDLVLTATWDPGYRVPIALVGIIDLDNDGKSDRLRLVQMIEKNGGRVVAQHDEEGNIIGKIDAETRYVVLGNSTSGGTDFNPNVQLAIQALRTQARENSVQQIGVRRLLNWMGIHGRAQVEYLDERAGDQFRRRDVIDALQPVEDR